MRRGPRRLLLQADLLAAPVATIGGDQDLRAAVVDPARQGLRREAPEDDRVGRPDPCAGQHRDRQLRDHRHVDRDPVAGPDAQLLQRVGRLADLAEEVAEGQRPGVARLADPVVGDLVAEAVLDVPVDAVVGDVQLAAGEPLRERQLPFERLVEGLRPVDPLAGALRPERLEVGLRLGVQVLGRVGLGGEGRVRREEPRLREEVFDLRRRKRVLDAHGSLVSKLVWPGHRTAPHAPRATATGGASDATGTRSAGRLGRCRSSGSRSPRPRSRPRWTRPCRPRSRRSRPPAGSGRRSCACPDRPARPSRPGAACAGRHRGRPRRRAGDGRGGRP